MMYEVEQGVYINTNFIVSISPVKAFLTDVEGKPISCGFYIGLQGDESSFISKRFYNREDAEIERKKLLNYMNYGV